jgi:hypothetical protein
MLKDYQEHKNNNRTFQQSLSNRDQTKKQKNQNYNNK